MAVEPLLLLLERSAVPVSVQSGLAHGDDAGLGDQVDDDRPVSLAGFGRVVGVDADGREEAAVCLQQVRPQPRSWPRCADGDDLTHAGSDWPGLARPSRSARSRRSSRCACVSTSVDGFWRREVHGLAAPCVRRMGSLGWKLPCASPSRRLDSVVPREGPFW